MLLTKLNFHDSLQSCQQEQGVLEKSCAHLLILAPTGMRSLALFSTYMLDHHPPPSFQCVQTQLFSQRQSHEWSEFVLVGLSMCMSIQILL